jgi:copper chaperone
MGGIAMRSDMCGTDGNHECACGTTATLEIGRAPHHAPEAAATTSYGVEGMTCSHCVTSVTQELSGLHGVQQVNVDLVVGGVSRVTVASATVLEHDEVVAAIDEAGYQLADLPR